MKFTFNEQNFANTSTVLTATTNSSQLINLFDRDTSTSWNGLGTFYWVPANTTCVSTIQLKGLSATQLKIFYNSTTSSNFTLSGYSTNTSVWTSNAETSMYLNIASTNVTSIGFKFGASATVKELFISNKIFTMANNPPAKNYKPEPSDKSLTHEMSDGGVVKYFIAEKWNATIDLNFIPTAEKANFRTLYEYNKTRPFEFTEFPTVTGWDEGSHEVNWVSNGFDFYKLENESKSVGFQGTVKIKET